LKVFDQSTQRFKARTRHQQSHLCEQASFEPEKLSATAAYDQPLGDGGANVRTALISA
jgi:hypothetical protein